MTQKFISFEPVIPDARVSMLVKNGKQYLEGPSLLQHVCKINDWQHVVNAWEDLARKEEWKPETIEGRLQDGCYFYGITFPGAIRLLEHLGTRVKLTDEQRASVVQVIRARFTGSQALVGGLVSAGASGASGDQEPRQEAVTPAAKVKKVRSVRIDAKVGGGNDVVVRDSDKDASSRVIKAADQVSVLKIDGIDGGRIRMVVKDGVKYLSARDIIRFQCQKNNKQVLQAWDKLDPEFMAGIKECMDLFTFSGSGEANQPVLEVRAALELVMHLECAHAERNRSRMLAALAGVWTGDSGRMAEASRVIRERAKAVLLGMDRVQDMLDGSGESAEKRAKHV